MAWEISDWTLGGAKGKPLTISWERTDSAQPGAKKRGMFEYAPTGSQTWDQIRAEVATKINNEEGLEEED